MTSSCSDIRSCSGAEKKNKNIRFPRGPEEIAAAALVNPDGLQTVSEPRTESPQSPDKLPPLIFLAFDLETEAGSLHISPGHRSGSNVFPIEARSVCASGFTSVLKWFFQGKP